MDIIALVLSIIVFIKLGKIESRLNKLQPKEQLQQPALLETPTTDSDSMEKPLTSPDNTPTEPSGFEKFFAWYAHEWMLKTGALLILLGFIWFATYAFLNNWIGPIGRISLGLVAGALILYAGEHRLSKIRTQGITIVWLGAAVMIVTIYAAQEIYQMFPATVALLFLALTTVVTAIISLRHQSLSLSVASLIIGGIAPLIIGSTENSIFGLYSYLIIITLGTIWIARHRKWEILTFLALIITTLYSFLYFFSSAEYLMSTLTPLEFLQLRFFAATLTGIFFLVSLMTVITNKAVTKVDLITAGAVGLYTYGWINGLIPDEYKGLVTATAALFYSGASFITFTRTSLKQPVYLYTTIAVILLAIATAFEFEGPVLIMAFSIQALVLPIVGVRLLGADVGKYILFYFILPIFLSLESIVSSWGTELFQNEFYALTIVTTTLLASGIYFSYDKNVRNNALHEASTFIIVTGSIYALLWIWKVFHTIITPEYFATMATLVVYTGIGLFTYITGDVQKRKVLHKFGLFTLIFVVGRLFIVEIWNMELTGKIITFFMIGTLLAGSVLLRKQHSEKL